MEYGDAASELEAKGYAVTRSNEGAVIQITNRWGEVLEMPTDSDLVRLATGMTIPQLIAERNG